MPDEDVIFFEMGLYRAALPLRLRYAEIHFWFETREGAGAVRTRCGLTSFATRLLDDVFRLDWKVYVGEQVEVAQPLGEVESTKASSELYAPMRGRVTDLNQEMVQQPARIAVDPYAHWLLEFDGRPERPMDAEAYRNLLAEGWEETQRLLKGQL